MMLQSLVENAIKHGLEPKPEGGALRVDAEVAHGKLVVTVSDTGVGFGRAATRERGPASTASASASSSSTARKPSCASRQFADWHPGQRRRTLQDCMTPRAVIADDEALMREQLRARLAEVWPELEIVAEARNGAEAVELVAAEHPNVVFLDIRMPAKSGIEAAREIAALPRGASVPEIVFVTPTTSTRSTPSSRG